MRIAATPAGAVVDPSGGAPGRGAYVCRERTCMEHALRKGHLARGLRVRLEPPDLTRLEAALEAVLSEGPRGGAGNRA